MKPTKTDRERSLESHEYLWDTSNDTEVHAYVGPVLAKWVRPYAGAHLLDLGCGNGALTAKIASLGLSCRGTDFSESGIEIAKSSHPGVSFFQSRLENELVREHRGVYDICIAVEVIEHLLLPRQLFARAREALKSDGVLIVTTPYHGYLKNIALALAGKFDSHWHPLRDFGHVKFFSITTLTNLFREEGFEVLEVTRVGRIPALARSMMIKGRLIE